MSASSVSTNATVVALKEREAGLRSGVRPSATSACLIGVDAVAIVGATLLGVWLWSQVNPSITLANYFHLGIVLALYLLTYRSLGLHSPAGLGPVEELRRIVLATALVSLVLTAAVFLAKEVGTYSRGAFLVSGALISVTVPLARAGVRALFAQQEWWGVPVLILGAGRTATLLIEKLRAEPGLGLKPVACLDDAPARHGECNGVPAPGPLSLAPELAQSLRVRHLLVAMPGVARERLVVILERYGAPFARVIVIPNLFGMASLWVSTQDLGGVLGLEVRQNLLAPTNRAVKRALDLVLAGVLGLLSLPVIAVAALWIKQASPGPVFFTQRREGAGGCVIPVTKLRTMHEDADELLEAHLEGSAEARFEWESHYKLKDDPRVIPGIGHFLRRTSLDELPQLWSVLQGEMSLVGPRPFPDYHLSQFNDDFRALRGRVRPGLTGLWQVSARSDGDLTVQQELDTYYIRNWSLWLEAHILARTVSTVLRGQGAY